MKSFYLMSLFAAWGGAYGLVFGLIGMAMYWLEGVFSCACGCGRESDKASDKASDTASDSPPSVLVGPGQMHHKLSTSNL